MSNLPWLTPPHSFPINKLSFGSDFAVVTAPGELFSALALEIMEKSHFGITMVTSQTNGAVGYIPTAEDFTAGGYETWFGEHSLLEPGAGELIVEKALELLENDGG